MNTLYTKRPIFFLYLDFFINNKWLVLCFYATLLLVFRWFTFQIWSFNPDESTYLIVARDWFAGKKLYQETIDIKPPGMYLILGVLQKIGLGSIFWIRFFTTLIISITAFLTYSIGKELKYSSVAAFLAGMTYCVLFTYPFTFSTNTEHYFVCLNVLGLYCLIKSGTLKYSFWGFLLVGCAFTIKQLAFMDFLAFGLGITFYYQLYKEPSQWVKHALVGAGAFLLPFFLTCLYFLVFENFAAFLEYSFHVPLKYATIRLKNNNITDFLSISITFILNIIIAFISIKKDFKKVIIPITWLLFTLMATQVTGKGFDHYLIQVFPAFSLIAALSVDTPLQTKHKFAVSFLLLIALATTWIANMQTHLPIIEQSKKQDNIYSYLKKEVQPTEKVFCGNYQQLIYYTLEKESPTPYIHNTILHKKIYHKVFDVDTTNEINNIINFNPDWITTYNDYPLKKMKLHIQQNYTLKKQFDEVKIWKHQ